jgi:hypothetical protein
METQALTVDRDEAVKMWKKYQAHRHNQSAIDAEIERIYKAIAQGKVIVRALESVVKAGLDSEHLPKLAMVRADDKWCWLNTGRDGSATFSGMRWATARTAASRAFRFPAGSFPGIDQRDWKAVTPHIPPDIRPKRGIENYTILFEPNWHAEPPIDPLLLRRLARHGDMWLVVAGWDLTPIERGVMADHMAAERRQ